MLGCQALGLAIGAVAERALDERLAAHRVAHPMGGSGEGGGGAGADDEPVLIV